MATKGSLLQRFSRRVAVGAAAVCALALMTVPVLAQFGAARRRLVRFFFRPSPACRATAPSERPSTSAGRPRRASSTPAGSKTVLVLGDSMADWLAYGLEEAFGDSPEIGCDPQSKRAPRVDPVRQPHEISTGRLSPRDLAPKTKPISS